MHTFYVRVTITEACQCHRDVGSGDDGDGGSDGIGSDGEQKEEVMDVVTLAIGMTR